LTWQVRRSGWLWRAGAAPTDAIDLPLSKRRFCLLVKAMHAGVQHGADGGLVFLGGLRL
jgi:hypothetical protein